MKFDIEQFIEASKLSSMDHWFPLTKDLPIPQPRTEAVLTMGTDMWNKFVQDPNTLNKKIYDLLSYADKMGFPIFIRTDQASAKHSYVDTCMVKDRNHLGHPTLSSLGKTVMRTR